MGLTKPYTPVYYPPYYVTCFPLMALFSVSLLIIFFKSLSIRKRKWKIITESSFLTLIVVSALFWFLVHSLTLTSHLAILLRAPLPMTFAYINSLRMTFQLIADLTFLAAIYCIFHNRLRAVAENRSDTTMLVKVHWVLLAVYLVLGVVVVGDYWASGAFNVFRLGGMKKTHYGTWLLDFMKSDFHTVHVRRIGAAQTLLRWVMQAELIWTSIIKILVWKMPKEAYVSKKARKATLLFFRGALALYILAPTKNCISLFLFQHPKLRYREWLMPLGLGIEGIALVIALAVLCKFANEMPAKDWELGSSKHRSHDGKENM